MALGDVIARLAVNLSLETVAFEKGATLAEKRANQMQRKFSKLGDQIGSLGQKMTIGLTAPLAAFGVSAFNAASDAAELQSAFDQTFGDLSKSMNEWAEATGNAMGRSTQELQKAANTFGIFFNQAAPTREAAADMSKTFTVLAQDLASFYNVSESDALQKLRSGLSGEAEPLRDFGVFLSAAAVEAKGLEMGLGGLTGELSEQEKIMARYQLILESTTNAQGDVARTSDGTANQMRKAKAAFEELQVLIGTKLLPALTPLIEKISSAVNWFTQLPEPVQNTVLVVVALSAALGPVLMAVGSLITLLGTIGPPMLAFASGLTGIGVASGAAATGATAVGIAVRAMLGPIGLAITAATAIYLAWKNWDKITAIVQRVYQGVKKWLMDKLGLIFNWVTDKVKKVEQGFAWLYDKVVGNSWVPDMVAEVGQHMAKLDKLMVDPATAATQSVNEAFRTLASNVSSILDRLFPQVAKLRTMYAELGVIDEAEKKGLLSGDLAQEARTRLRAETRGTGSAAPTILSNALPTIDMGKTMESVMEDIGKKLGHLGDKSKATTVKIAESFKDMAEKSISALRSFADAIKGGGFLDILEAGVNLFMNLAGNGVFGKGLQGKVNSTPGYATGTNSAARGWAWVGERGPELVKFRGGERVLNNRDSMNAGGGPQRVEIIPSPYFDVVVDGRVMRAAPAIAQGGAQLAGQQAMFQRSRRLA